MAALFHLFTLFPKPLDNSACFIALILPSIMSEGAMMWQPVEEMTKKTQLGKHWLIQFNFIFNIWVNVELTLLYSVFLQLIVIILYFL